jgi:uncharacterized protein YndB with AHSA1/START domain
VDRVFAALTREDELRRWFSREARFDPRPGASYRFADPGFVVAGQGRVRRVEPPGHVEPGHIDLTWHWDPELPPTELTLALEQDAAGVRLHLEHAGWGTGCEWNRAIEEIDEAWEDALFLLRRYLVGPRGEADRGPGGGRRP